MDNDVYGPRTMSLLSRFLSGQSENYFTRLPLTNLEDLISASLVGATVLSWNSF